MQKCYRHANSVSYSIKLEVKVLEIHKLFFGSHTPWQHVYEITYEHSDYVHDFDIVSLGIFKLSKCEYHF